MILPIYAYGQPVLKKVAEDITADYPDLQQLIANMWETMYHAHGVGLAAPQIGLSIRLFVVDSVPMMEEGKEAEGIKRVFINAHKVEETGPPGLMKRAASAFRTSAATWIAHRCCACASSMKTLFSTKRSLPA